MDIVERLRLRKAYTVGVGELFDPGCQEAADEIERLREALKRLADPWDDVAQHQPYLIAQAALQQKESE